MGREIDAKPALLIVSQPTWGVDVGASSQIRGELLKLAGAGGAVLVVSEELDELFEICDRLYVMAKGQLSPSLPRAEATVEKVGLWMSGLWAPAAAPRERGMKLEMRPQPSSFWSYASPILALLITVAIGIGLFMALGKDPVKGLQVFFWEPVKSPYALGELLVKATPLLIIALGPGGVLSLQCLEHRRRRAVRHRRAGGRRRGAAGRQDHRAVDHPGHSGGGRAGRHGLGGHHRLAARPLQRQ